MAKEAGGHERVKEFFDGIEEVVDGQEGERIPWKKYEARCWTEYLYRRPSFSTEEEFTKICKPPGIAMRIFSI